MTEDETYAGLTRMAVRLLVERREAERGGR